MGLMEILMLVIGAAIVIASFWIPGKKQTEDSTAAMTKEQIKELFDDEYTDIKVRLSQLTDETVEYSLEKVERILERIANEKMLAFGEYSDSTLDQISANHQETVFMYDMLNKSKQDLTELLLQTDKNAQDALVSAQDALKACEGAKIYASEAMELAEAAKTQSKDAKVQADAVGKSVLLARRLAQEEIRSHSRAIEKAEAQINSLINNQKNTVDERKNDKENYSAAENAAAAQADISTNISKNISKNIDTDINADTDVNVNTDVDVNSDVDITDVEAGITDVDTEADIDELSTVKTTVKGTAAKQNSQLSFTEELLRNETDVSLSFTPGEGNRANSNERILELHRRGKSNMAIAKDLGLGIGEVKLVIDLFDNK